MARIITEQKNRWGAARTQKGLDPQRVDLWVVDFTASVNNLNEIYQNNFGEQINPVPSYFAQSITLPELRVKGDAIRRNSRPYNMPSWDDPMDPVKMTFLIENRTDAKSSHIYQLLDTWRLAVRAGRGAMGTERDVRLNTDYRINFRFPLYLTLLRGARVPLSDVTATSPAPSPVRTTTSFSTTSTVGNPTAQQGTGSLFLRRVAARLARDRANNPNFATSQAGATPFLLNNDLQLSGFYVLQNCWLGGFRLDTLSYAQNGLAALEATIYVENVLDNQAL